MKHPSTRAVYDYWNLRSGSRPAPERGDIDPTEIRHALGDTFMLAADFVDAAALPSRRHARLRAVLPRDQGRGLRRDLEHRMPQGGRRADARWSTKKTPARSPASPRIPRKARRAELEMLLLPLAHSGHARIRALGVLAPTVPPYWLGAQPVDRARARHRAPYRGGAEGRSAPRFGRAVAGSRLRHGFVVYSGGRETPPGERTG